MSIELAATATVLILAAGYAVSCAYWPFTSCWSCDSGKKRSPTGRSWRTCKRCKGSGARLRIGRRLWNSWSGTRDRAR